MAPFDGEFLAIQSATVEIRRGKEQQQEEEVRRSHRMKI